MSVPRPVFPGKFLFITRRCSQRQYLLRPDDETNNAFVYCLAEAAQHCGMTVVLPQMMSNHHHTVLHDHFGRHVEFRERFHGMLAKCQNALRGRWENLWATEEPCVIEVVEREDLMNKLVYVATNPVKDGLVAEVSHWPGPKLVRALLRQKRIRAQRPTHFFRTDGPMPESVELELGLPADFEDQEGFLRELERRIEEVEVTCARQRNASGRRVLGRRRIRRQSWRDSPTSQEPRRNLRPRVAARSKWARIATMQRNREFEAAYRDARESWIAGNPSLFPYGTYWLRRFANVTVCPPAEC